MKPLSPGSRDDAGETAPLECQACLWSSTQTIRPAVARNSAVGISSPWIRDANWLLPLHKHTWRAPHTRLRFNHFRPQTLHGRPRYSKWWPYVGPYYIALLVKEKLISLLEATSSHKPNPNNLTCEMIHPQYLLQVYFKSQAFPDLNTKVCWKMRRNLSRFYDHKVILIYIYIYLPVLSMYCKFLSSIMDLSTWPRQPETPNLALCLLTQLPGFQIIFSNCVESNKLFTETCNYLTTCLRNYGCAVMTVKNSAANVVRKPVWPCRFGCYYHFELLLFLFKLLLIHILWILDGKTQYWIKKPKTLKSLVLMLTPWCLEW